LQGRHNNMAVVRGERGVAGATQQHGSGESKGGEGWSLKCFMSSNRCCFVLCLPCTSVPTYLNTFELLLLLLLPLLLLWLLLPLLAVPWGCPGGAAGSHEYPCLTRQRCILHPPRRPLHLRGWRRRVVASVSFTGHRRSERQSPGTPPCSRAAAAAVSGGKTQRWPCLLVV
jgi:hypothetical protein